MNVKTFKRMSKRCISALLSVLMVLSLFTVCMVGTTVTASATIDNPTSSWTSVSSGTTVTFDATATGWNSTVYLYIGRYHDYGGIVTTSKYSMTKSSDDANIWSYTFSNSWDKYQYFFFSTESKTTGNGDKYRVDKVHDSITDNSTKTKLICIDDMELNGGKFKATGTTTPYAVTDGTVYGYVDATLFNYRNATQISNDSDWADGQANSPYDFNVYGDYNTAVADWYRDNKVVGSTYTPLYQGNFRQGEEDTQGVQIGGTIGYVQGTYKDLFYNFYSVANGTNRYNGMSNNSASSAATGLVDARLNANNNITQNGVELPQFSTAFMEKYNGKTVKDITRYSGTQGQVISGTDVEKTFGTIQTSYTGLKFPFDTKKSQNGNTIYYYDAAQMKNRYYDEDTNSIKVGGTVKGCKNEVSDEGTQGYYPFNPTNPGTKSQIVNCFGTRFDLEFYMTADGTLNEEPLTFEFTGDDDVWVYIDGYLALDLGGAHNAAAGIINLKDKTAQIKSGYYNGVYNDTYKFHSGLNTEVGYVSASNATAQPLSDELKTSLSNTSKMHTLTVFYLERGTFDSNFSMSYMLPTTSKLTIEEKIDTSDVNPGLVNDTMKAADKDVFDIVLGSNSASAEKNSNAQLPIKAPFVRKNPYSSNTILQNSGTGTSTEHKYTKNDTNTVKGTAFSWNDTYSSSVGTGLTSDNGNVHLLYDQSATFNDQFKAGSDVFIKQLDEIKKFTTVSENPPETTGADRLVSSYYTTSYVIKDAQGSVIGSGSNNTATETVLKATGSSSSAIPFNNANHTAADNIQLNAVITNKVKTGSISFKKDVVEEEKNSENYDKYYGETVFKFKVEVSQVLGDKTSSAFYVPTGLTYTVYDVNGNPVPNRSGEFVTEEDIIDISVNESFKIDGIPVGTKYKVTEVGTLQNTNVNFSVADVDTSGSADGAVVEPDSTVQNGFAAVIGDVKTDENKSVFKFDNTTSTKSVIYRFIDRKIVDGKPTSTEDHYTYFVKNIPSTSEANILKYAPNISNVLYDYNLPSESCTVEVAGLGTVECGIKKFNANELTFTKDAQGKIIDEGVTTKIEGLDQSIEDLAKQEVYVATYKHTQHMYTLTFDIGDTARTTKTLQKPFNGLVDLVSDRVFAAPTNSVGAKFLYWAKLVDIDGTNEEFNKIYTPVSTNFFYAYRVTDDAHFKAIYENDINTDGSSFKQKLDAPYDIFEEKYLQQEIGYDAVTAERVYDSYSIDGINRTRVNVVFGSIGSLDVDTAITDVGYILIKGDEYLPDSLFKESDLEEVANMCLDPDKKDKVNKGTQGKINNDKYAYLMKNYQIRGHMPDGSEDDDYQAYQNNLTNKNRLNIVFDLVNDEAHQKNFYTCYTYMVRTYTDENGAEQTKVYVSDTPAFFNLKEADPTVKEEVIVGNTYPVVTSTTGAQGSLISGTKIVAEGTQVNLKITPATYTDNGQHYQTKLTSLKIGKVTYNADQLVALGVPVNGGTYSFTFDSSVYLNDDDTDLTIVANFVSAAAGEKTVIAPTVTGGTVQVGVMVDGVVQYGSSAKITYGDTLYVKATPSEDYNFSAWKDGADYTAESDGSVVRVFENFSPAVTEANYTPIFTQKPVSQVNLTVNIAGEAAGCKKVVVTYTVNREQQTAEITANTTIPVDKGTTANIKPYANSGYEYTATAANVTMSGDQTVTITYEKQAGKTIFIVNGKSGSNWPIYVVSDKLDGWVNWITITTNPNHSKITSVNIGTSSKGTYSGDVYQVTLDPSVENINLSFNKDQKFNPGRITDGMWIYFTSSNTQTDGVEIKPYPNGEGWSTDSITIKHTLTLKAGEGGTAKYDSTTVQAGGTSSPITVSSPVTVEATANAGYRFVSWTDKSGTVVSTDATASITITGNTTLKANFEKLKPAKITVSANMYGTVTYKNGDNEVTIDAGLTREFEADLGTTVELKAIPNPGDYRFVNWTDINNTVLYTETPYSFEVTEDTTITANFAEITYSEFTIASSDNNKGSVAVTDGSYTVLGNDKYKVMSGNEVTLKATPANNTYKFVKWTKTSADDTVTDVSTNAEYTFAPEDGVTYTAVFEQKQNITVTYEAVGGGTINGNAESSTTVLEGQSVTLTATANSGYNFVNWTDADGNELSDNATYTFTPNADTTVYANFEEIQEVKFKVETAGDGLGTVTVKQGSTALAPDSNGDYTVEPNTQVTLTATVENSTYCTFSGWSGSYSSNDNTITITPTANATYTATFNLKNTYYVVGNNSTLFGGKTWSSAAIEHNKATYIGGGKYQKVYENISLADTTIEYKFYDGINSWIPKDNQTVELIANDATLTFTLDLANNSVTCNVEYPSYNVYFKPDTNWASAGARFAVCVQDGSDQDGSDHWYDMTQVGNTGYYHVKIPVAYAGKDLIFCRMNPNTTENNWNEGTKWNSDKTTVPTTDNRCYTLNATSSGSSWDNPKGTWSDYTS